MSAQLPATRRPFKHAVRPRAPACDRVAMARSLLVALSFALAALWVEVVWFVFVPNSEPWASITTLAKLGRILVYGLLGCTIVAFAGFLLQLLDCLLIGGGVMEWLKKQMEGGGSSGGKSTLGGAGAIALSLAGGGVIAATVALTLQPQKMEPVSVQFVSQAMEPIKLTFDPVVADATATLSLNVGSPSVSLGPGGRANTLAMVTITNIVSPPNVSVTFSPPPQNPASDFAELREALLKLTRASQQQAEASAHQLAMVLHNALTINGMADSMVVTAPGQSSACAGFVVPRGLEPVELARLRDMWTRLAAVESTPTSALVKGYVKCLDAAARSMPK